MTGRVERAFTLLVFSTGVTLVVVAIAQILIGVANAR
jgi:hypothetical protein